MAFLIAFMFLTLLAFGSMLFVSGKDVAQAAGCQIVSAKFIPSGAQVDTWFSESNPKEVIIDVQTQGCAGEAIDISVTSEIGIDADVDAMNNKRFLNWPQSEHARIRLSSGEENCSKDPDDIDCVYHIEFSQGAGSFTNLGDTSGNPDGMLMYECEGWSCLQVDWEYLGFEEVGGSSSDDDDDNNDSSADTYTSSGPESSGGLVPCRNNCDFDQVMVLVSNIINFIFILVVPIAAIVFAYAGFLLIFSGSKPESRTKAKAMFGKVAGGIVIILAAWLIVATILKSLGVPDAYVLLDIGP